MDSLDVVLFLIMKVVPIFIKVFFKKKKIHILNIIYKSLQIFIE